jgi:hypothetical protein
MTGGFLTIPSGVPSQRGSVVPDDRSARLAAVPKKWANPPADMISKLPKGGAMLDYMGHADVTLALLDVDPEWTLEPILVDGLPAVTRNEKGYVLWCYLTVLGHKRICVGTCETSKKEPEKELIGDALRNGALRFGIGTGLWSKSDKSAKPEADPFIAREDVEAAVARIKAMTSTQKAHVMADLNAKYGTHDFTTLKADQTDALFIIISAAETK